MDNLPVAPLAPITPATVVVPASGMKTSIIVALIATVLVGAGITTWLYTSSSNDSSASDEMSDTPPSLKQVTSGLKGSLIDTLNNCRGFDATETAAWPALEAKLKADNVPSMQLVSGLNFGIATKDTKLSDVMKNPEVKCVITAVYDDGKWYLDPDPKGMFGNATVTITDPSTFIIKEGYGAVMFAQKPGTLYGLVDASSPLSKAPKFDENAHGWFLTGETASGDFLKSVLPRNPNSWIYNLSAPEAKSGLVFSKIADPTTQKFDKVFLMWTRLGVKGGGGVTEGETPIPVVTKEVIIDEKKPDVTQSDIPGTTIEEEKKQEPKTCPTGEGLAKVVDATGVESAVCMIIPTEALPTPPPPEEKKQEPKTCPTGEYLDVGVGASGAPYEICRPIPTEEVLPMPPTTKGGATQEQLDERLRLAAEAKARRSVETPVDPVRPLTQAEKEAAARLAAEGGGTTGTTTKPKLIILP